MKNSIIMLFAAACLWAAPACNFLDVVPEDRASEEDAFKDVQALKRYLYGCYSAIPIPHHCVQSADLFTADEVAIAPTHEVFNSFLTGQYTTSESGSSQQNIHNVLTWRTVPQAIQNCYLLLQNIDKVPGVTAGEKTFYNSQAHFLIGYLHYLMLRQYGPIILMKDVAPLTLPESEFPTRSPYDECVKFITDELDAAISLGLSAAENMEANEYGLGSKEAALALKGRILLYAASPLFNGGIPSTPEGAEHVSNLTTGTDNMSAEWASFTNKSADGGQQLISNEFDQEKWIAAKEACKEAVDAAELGGFELYTRANEKVDAGTMKFPTDPTERQLRLISIDRMGTKELILADCRNGSTPVTAYGIHKRSAPTGSATFGYNSCAPTLTMVETFYTKNGLPINEDNQWSGYSNPYAVKPNTIAAPTAPGITGIVPPKNAHYKGGNFPWDNQEFLNNTMALNLDREPRFNAWIACHGSYYEYNTAGNTGTNRTQGLIAVGFRLKDNCGSNGKSQNYSLTGYLLKKPVSPLNSEGSTTGSTSHVFPWPVIRLAEVYLNYAEALVECGELDKAIYYIDKVRTRAGLKGIVEAWQPTGKSPASNKDLLRRIVRQERTIELYMENHRFWDIRRWLLGTKYFGAKVRGMNVAGETDNEFLQVKEIERPRLFLKAHYLMPIPISEINKNAKLVQNPGY